MKLVQYLLERLPDRLDPALTIQDCEVLMNPISKVLGDVQGFRLPGVA
jgi:hypothetical protein